MKIEAKSYFDVIKEIFNNEGINISDIEKDPIYHQALNEAIVTTDAHHKTWQLKHSGESE